MTGGLAMKLKLELAQLAQRHRVTPTISCALPLAAPASRPVLISGIAASTTVDQDRMRFRSRALVFLPWRLPPLLFRHREPAGEILKLDYDARGRLLVEARVDHVEARRCSGLSLAATIVQYELRDQDDPENFHALITGADLDEISITPTPANPDCVISWRIPTSPQPEFFDLARQGIGKIIEIVELLRKLDAQSSPPAPKPAPPVARPRLPVEPHRATEFGKFITAMERAHAS
jgi:YD repeat-containing protein